ncbi:MAG TPA: MotA/TolQ/ExbB proton channel family protein [Rubricoccaceae bacterium]
MPALQTALVDTLAAGTLATADTLARAAVPLATAPAPFSVADFFVHGGWALVPIALALVAAVAAVVGVLRTVGDVSDDADGLVRTVGDYIRSGNLIGALDFCRSQDSVSARVVSEGLQRLGRPLGDIQTAVSAAARRETARVQTRLDLVRTAAVLAPALGLLGTAAGLIGVLRAAGEAVPSAAALWPPLVPGVVGPLVGAVALGLYHAFAGRAADFAASLDTVAGDFLALLQAPAARRGA